MQRVNRLNKLWNRLPAFRVVAETEYLPEAAELLNVTPSALSRSIRLLEDVLGCQLFERSARRMVLNEQGRVLLEQVRIAMRHVDDGVSFMEGSQEPPLLALAAYGGVAWSHLGKMMTRLNQRYPELVLQSRACGPKESATALQRGTLDLAIVAPTAPRPGLELRHLGSMPCGVYCGPLHPFARKAPASCEEVLNYPFVAPLPEDPDSVDDGWPAQLHRRVSFYVTDPVFMVDHVLEDELCLVMLPHYLPKSSLGHASQLTHVDVPIPGAAVSLSALYRKPLNSLQAGTHRLVNEACNILTQQLRARKHIGAAPLPRETSNVG